MLLRCCLVRAVTKLGRRIDPLKVNLLQCLSAGVNKHGLSESDDSLLDTGHGTLDEEEVVVDWAITYEATHSVIN